MEKSKILATLMSTSCSLDKNEDRKPIEERKYQGMIGFILYLIVYCLGIIFVVCMCAHFQASPKESHLRVIKNIMRYLTIIKQMGLWYPKGADCDLVGYSDSNFVGCILDRKSICGTCHLFGNSLVSCNKNK